MVGHSRLLAARKLGLLEVPVHVAADLTEAQCRAYRIADNRAGEEARWDDELLKLEISELGELAGLTAFDPKEIKRLGLAEDAVQDAIPAPPASPVARLGQIWQLGKHRLHVWRFYAPGIRFTFDGRRAGGPVRDRPTLRSRLLWRLASGH